MTDKRLDEIRKQYTGPDGKLDVSPDDPRFQKSINYACEDIRTCYAQGLDHCAHNSKKCDAIRDLAERGHADVAADHIGAIDGAGVPDGMYVASTSNPCPTCGRYTLADGECGECQDHHARVRFREKHLAGVSPDAQGAASVVVFCVLLAVVFVAGLVVRDVFR